MFKPIKQETDNQSTKHKHTHKHCKDLSMNCKHKTTNIETSSIYTSQKQTYTQNGPHTNKENNKHHVNQPHLLNIADK